MPDSFSRVTEIPGTDFQEPTVYDFNFTGSAFEYFRIWIVNLFLSIITLGIYSAWAKVRTKRYFYGNTLLNGSSFDYTAEPIQILKGRFIALGLLIVYQGVAYFLPHLASFAFLVLVAIAPLVIVLSMRFRMRNTVWRGIRFGFKTDFKKAYLLFLPPIIYVAAIAIAPVLLGVDITVLEEGNNMDATEAAGISSYFQVLGILVVIAALLFPWWQKKYYDFIGKNSRFGVSEFLLQTTTGSFYIIYLLALLIFILCAGIGGSIAAALVYGYVGSQSTLMSVGMVAGLLLVTAAYIVPIVYVMTKKTNLLYNNLSLDNESVRFKSDLSTPYMIYLYITNTLAILLTLSLAIPWAMVRTAKYRASKTAALSSNLDTFVAQQASEDNAVGEEVGEIFGLDIGI